MSPTPPDPRDDRHRHVAATTHVVRQRHGIPYEIERVVCTSCRQVLGERPVRRTAA